MRTQLTFESLSAAFFFALGIAAFATRGSVRRRVRTTALAIAIAVGVVAASRLSVDLRGWLAHAYLVAGYWIPAMLVPPDVKPGRFEAWLTGSNERWPTRTRRLPPWIAAALELAYLLCYVLVPIAFAFVWTLGSTLEIDSFWTAVLASGFICYGSLPWLISRPPRALRAIDDSSMIRRVNRFVLARVSHGLNTFPSGHVAVSVAAALEVHAVSRAAGVVLIAIAALISAGAVAGRYHYAVDVVVGAALGVFFSWVM